MVVDRLCHGLCEVLYASDCHWHGQKLRALNPLVFFLSCWKLHRLLQVCKIRGHRVFFRCDYHSDTNLTES